MNKMPEHERTAVANNPTSSLDKMVSVHDKSQAIGEFLDWLQGKVSFAVPHLHNEHCFMSEDELEKQGFPRHFMGYNVSKLCDLDEGQLSYANIGTIEQILADYFEIDLQQVAKEQMAILDNIRESGNSHAPPSRDGEPPIGESHTEQPANTASSGGATELKGKL